MEGLEKGDVDRCEVRRATGLNSHAFGDMVDNGLPRGRQEPHDALYFTACQAFSAGFDIYDFTFLFH